MGRYTMKKILAITDFDTVGSGYKSICAPLFIKLKEMGYEIIVVGLMYQGQEHNYPFSVLPCLSLQDGEAIATNVLHLWQPEIILVALDIPLQIQYHAKLSAFKKKYIAITPLENGPLTMSWAAPLMNMDAVFFISELGKQEALKVGVKAEHLQVGVDTASWRLPFPEEKAKLRNGLGIDKDAFVVLTVADNQERKNLSAGMEVISNLKKLGVPVKWVLVTRETNPYGWKLRDLAVKYGVNQEYSPYERGMPSEQLWGLYAISDAYLQPSKAEGLGLPVLDAMATGLPAVATKTGAMTELLSDNRGTLVPGYGFGEKDHFIDVWGNSGRVMMDIEKATDRLYNIWKNGFDVAPARAYVEARTHDIPAQQIDAKIKELLPDELEHDATTSQG